jgi:hypothetical protein
MSVSRKLTEEELKALSENFYTVDGELFAKKGAPKRPVGTKMCARQTKGRVKMVWCCGKSYPAHRVIYFLHTGVWPKGVVDHINGNPHDNRPENLRDITQSENTKSYGPAHKDSTSNFRGVHWFKRDSKWQSQIFCKGKKYHLGYFDSEREAAFVWNYSATKLGFNKEALNMVFEDYPAVDLSDLV